MLYRPLGNSGLEVSALCLGTMTWGEQNTEAEAFEQMDYALSQGINFFDTAEMYPIPASASTYTATETILGDWFSKRKIRKKIILATKVGGNGVQWMHGGTDINRVTITASVEGSLKRLKTDYIDLYQLHWPNRGSYHFGQLWNYKIKKSSNEHEKENFIEVLETLQSLITQGKIRYIGLSNETAWGTMQYLNLAQTRALPRIQSIQNEYNLLYRLHEGDMMEISLRENVGLLAWSPLAAGLLTGKYAQGARPKNTRWANQKKFNQRDTPQAHAAVDRYIKIAREHNMSPAQLSLAFVLSRPFVTSAIIGATSMEQLRENIGSIDKVLSQSAAHEIAAVWRDFPMPF